MILSPTHKLLIVVQRWRHVGPTAGKSFSKVFLEALRLHQFRAGVRDELIVDTHRWKTRRLFVVVAYT